MKITWIAAAVVVLAWGSTALASDPVGIYVLVDKVVLEPTEDNPERIKVWGTFAVATKGFGDEYEPPVHGYMYFALAKDKQDLCRKEWADLKKLAGSGQCVAFGSRYQPKGKIRKSRAQQEPVAVDEQRLNRLIADLDSSEFTVREKAKAELDKLGRAAVPALRKALAGQPSAEVKQSAEKLLEKLDPAPDPYPLGFGLQKIPSNREYGPVQALVTLPIPVSPGDDDVVATGKVTLVARNMPSAQRKGAKYVFEIESASGDKETSPATDAGEKETKWTPKMEVKAGSKYTWRVKAVDGEWKGPVANVEFQGKP